MILQLQRHTSDTAMILARYSRFKAVGCCLGATTFALYALAIPFIYSDGIGAYLSNNDNNYLSRFYPIVAFLTTVALFFIVRLAVNVTAMGAVAISLEGNLLSLISGRVIRIQKQDIDKVGLQKGGAFPFEFSYLCFYLKNSEVRKVATSLFDESAEKVCKVVRAALDLPN